MAGAPPTCPIGKWCFGSTSTGSAGQQFGSGNNQTSIVNYDAVQSVVQFCITTPTLIPTCIVALYLGITLSRKIRKQTHFASSWMYSLTFFLYGLMMTNAMFADCFFPPTSSQQSIPSIVFGLVDVGLTSCVALGFFWAGLMDIKVVSSNSDITKGAILVSFASVFVGWYKVIVDKWTAGFIYLYMYLVGICCAIYLITQVVLLVHTKVTQGLVSLSLGGLAGFVGFVCLFFTPYICSALGPWGPFFGATFIWFVLSDVAVYFLAMYVIQSAKAREEEGATVFSPGAQQQQHQHQQIDSIAYSAPQQQQQPEPQYAPPIASTFNNNGFVAMYAPAQQQQQQQQYAYYQPIWLAQHQHHHQQQQQQQ